MSAIKCPDCGKLVSTSFPIHHCRDLNSEPVKAEFRYSVEYRVLVSSHCTPDDVWHGAVSIAEYRNGSQYGGTVSVELQSKTRHGLLRSMIAKAKDLMTINIQ